jgi:hypothetical protein
MQLRPQHPPQCVPAPRFTPECFAFFYVMATHLGGTSSGSVAQAPRHLLTSHSLAGSEVAPLTAASCRGLRNARPGTSHRRLFQRSYGLQSTALIERWYSRWKIRGTSDTTNFGLFHLIFGYAYQNNPAEELT